MMGGVSPKTCWASYKYGIIKFDTLLHLVGFFFMNCTMMHGSTNIKGEKKVCFTLHCNMNDSHSKTPFCVSQDILIENHIFIYNKVLRQAYFNIQQNNDGAYTSVHMAARTIWLQAVQYLVFQLLYTAHLVDINAHIQNAITNKIIITLNQPRNQKGQCKYVTKKYVQGNNFYILQLKGNKILWYIQSGLLNCFIWHMAIFTFCN